MPTKRYRITGERGKLVGCDIVVDDGAAPEWWRVERVERRAGFLAAVVTKAGRAPMVLTGLPDHKFTRRLYVAKRWKL